MKITLYSRHGCHLCEDALKLLSKYQASCQLTIQEVDIDGDPELVARYGDKVPVLEIDGRPRLWGNINEVLLRRELSKGVR